MVIKVQHYQDLSNSKVHLIDLLVVSPAVQTLNSSGVSGGTTSAVEAGHKGARATSTEQLAGLGAIHQQALGGKSKFLS